MNFVWITPKWPLPAEDGARQATFHLVRGLCQLGAEVHLISLVREPVSTEAISESLQVLGVKSAKIVAQASSSMVARGASFIFHPSVPLTVVPFSSRAIRAEISALIRPDSRIVFDGVHTAGWLPSDFRACELIYRSHNVESDLWVQAAKQARNPFVRLLMKNQARVMASFEKRVCRQSRLVAAVSDLDRERLEARYEIRNTVTTPIGITLAPVSDFPRERKLLFLGRLDWKPNREGLIWFLEKIWPRAVAASPDLSLTIAGAGNGSYLDQFKHLPRITFLGRVPVVAPLYLESVASIVPIFLGSGTRVKAIEASSFGRPCISTAIGIEGIGLDPSRSYFKAENEEEWLRTILDLSLPEAERRGREAYQLISEKFDPRIIAGQFLSAIDRQSQRR